MKKIIVAIVFILGCVIHSGSFQDKELSFTNYQDMRKYVGELYSQKKYSEAVDVLRDALARFPGHLHANAYNLALMYRYLGEYEKGVKVMQYALEHGIWFGKYDFYNEEIWGPYKELSSFKTFLNQNEVFWKEAQNKAKPELVMSTPEGYNDQKEYRLFIALHGGNSNIENFRKSWISERLQQEFIVAYVQSSQVVSMDGYNWTEDMELSKKEIAVAYHKILKTHPVSADQVIIGGFSSGGVAALEVALNNTIPVSGFIVLCPAKPESFTAQKVIEAKRRGIRGTILTTEMDPRLPDQKKMNKILEAEGFPCAFIVTPDIGHWFPEDLDKKIDSAIDFILKK
jgi:predicted esterase